ncbi:DUF5357 family protein [Almyronema epifaneia]|uniref:DUF5357 family protein n=1 Tax=Almyronema epifaneia S1 TaxID=2991925 RepID=A0ABW6IDL7_9CYAN
MQSFDQITKLFKPPKLISWQTIFLIGLTGLLLAIALIQLGLNESTANLVVTVGWLLTTIGGGWGLLAVLSPTEYNSWQTVLMLSLFSWLTSLLAELVSATDFTVNVLSSFGWIFLIIGTGWGLSVNNVQIFGIPLSPWVSGALLCAFIFSPWANEGNVAPALVSWPIVSAAIAIVPNVLRWNFTFKKPDVPTRQQLALLFVFSLLLSGWLQFYFRLQRWLEDYPTLLVSNFRNSSFVYQVPSERERLPQGIPLLVAAETEVEQQLNGMPWPRVERWLLNVEEQLIPIERAAKNRLDAQKERDLWTLRARTFETPVGYDLRLQSIWLGPTSTAEGFYLEKTCLINRQLPAATPIAEAEAAEAEAEAEQPPTPLGTVDCELATDFVEGYPTQ